MVFRTYSKPVLLEPARAGAETREFVAEEDILQGQVVDKGGTNSDEVEPCDEDGARPVGVALFDASAGDTVTVLQEGARARLTSGTGTISAGDPIATHGSSGEEGEVDTAASGDFVMGTALKDDVGTNDDVEVILSFEGFASTNPA